MRPRHSHKFRAGTKKIRIQDTEDICPETGKICYLDAGDAFRRSAPGTLPYKCPSCGMWHSTKKRMQKPEHVRVSPWKYDNGIKSKTMEIGSPAISFLRIATMRISYGPEGVFWWVESPDYGTSEEFNKERKCRTWFKTKAMAEYQRLFGDKGNP